MQNINNLLNEKDPFMDNTSYRMIPKSSEVDVKLNKENAKVESSIIFGSDSKSFANQHPAIDNFNSKNIESINKHIEEDLFEDSVYRTVLKSCSVKVKISE